MKRHLVPSVAVAFLLSFAGVSEGDEFTNLDDSNQGPLVQPAVAEVPANHLKFYLHFREPMERGDVFRFLRLAEIDETGRETGEVPEPFREVELWDETFTRMTLWFHPGRQKPGVNLNVEIGPILEEGKRYRLEVSDKWKTESGGSLHGQLSHVFNAGPYDDTQPDPTKWKFHGAERGVLVRLQTDEILDPISAAKRIHVVDAEGKKVEPFPFSVLGDSIFFIYGKVGIEKRYRLVIDPRLEDLAGNSIARPFNLDLDKNPDFEERTEAVVIPFAIPLER